MRQKRIPSLGRVAGEKIGEPWYLFLWVDRGGAIFNRRGRKVQRRVAQGF
jgi:hypothetical protein